MFPSGDNTNTFPQIPSSFHVLPHSIVGHDANHFSLNNHNHDLLVGYLLPESSAPVAETTVSNTLLPVPAKASMRGQDMGKLNVDHCNRYNILPANRTARKDGHSKIFTAQGVRDRRVRLSIDIARKFFDLQDMLGFDKASKTLDWLLTKSKKAIKELVQMKNSCSGGSKSLSSISSSEYEVESETNQAAEHKDLQGTVLKKKQQVNFGKEKMMRQQNKDPLHVLAKESRAKARARARKRTQEKLSIRRHNEIKKATIATPHVANHSNTWNQIENCEELGSSYHDLSHTGLGEPILCNTQVNEASKEIIVEESIVTKRMLKPQQPFMYGYQHNFFVSKDLSLSSNNYSASNTENWDRGGTNARSNFCTVINMNATKELQILGKPWETFNKHSQQ